MVARLVPKLLFVLASCGRIGFDVESDPRRDGAVDAQGTCDRAAPFGAPVKIDELSDPTVGDGSLRILADERAGYFWSFRGGSEQAQIFHATRADLRTPWSVEATTGFEIGFGNLDPTPSLDGAVFLYRHTPPDDLMTATMLSPTTFANPTPVDSLNTLAKEMQPALRPFSDEVLFNSSRTGNGDLYRARRVGTAFTAPELISEIATDNDEGDPVLTRDGLTLYFRRSVGSTSDYDIYVTTRGTAADAFGPPALVPNVSSPDEDGPSAISEDDCRLYLTSDRDGTVDIFVATRGQ